jgi:simple sugar transport system ATP-binding protein
VKLETIMSENSLWVDLQARAGDLPVGLQQRVEILKLLYRDCDILILDEPTAVLTPQETFAFFEQLRKLKAQGKTILIITHKLKEVLAITDAVTVMRGGLTVGHKKTAETTIPELAQMMIGRASDLYLSLEERGLARIPEVALKVSAFSFANRLQNLNFEVHRGEIVGIAGVEGNGQSDLLRALISPQECRGETVGDIEVFRAKNPSSTRALKALSVAVLPENRIRQGVLSERPLWENWLLGYQRFCHNWGFLRSRQVQRTCESQLEEYDVRPRNRDLLAGRLSGGNQQKLVVARELGRDPQLIIAAHPTRGVDIGAIEFIHEEVLKARARGAAILLVSSELDEIMALADRALVFYSGRIQAQFARRDFDESRFGLAMAGGNET